MTLLGSSGRASCKTAELGQQLRRCSRPLRSAGQFGSTRDSSGRAPVSPHRRGVVGPSKRADGSYGFKEIHRNKLDLLLALLLGNQQTLFRFIEILRAEW